MVKRQFFNMDGKKETTELSLFQAIRKIYLERKCMAADCPDKGFYLSIKEIYHYLLEGFTITTYQADYVHSDYDFSFDE